MKNKAKIESRKTEKINEKKEYRKIKGKPILRKTSNKTLDKLSLFIEKKSNFSQS